MFKKLQIFEYRILESLSLIYAQGFFTMSEIEKSNDDMEKVKLSPTTWIKLTPDTRKPTVMLLKEMSNKIIQRLILSLEFGLVWLISGKARR